MDSTQKMDKLIKKNCEFTQTICVPEQCKFPHSYQYVVFKHLQTLQLWRISMCMLLISLFIMGQLKNHGCSQFNSWMAPFFLHLQVKEIDGFVTVRMNDRLEPCV